MRILIVLLISLAISFNSSLSSENPSSIKEAILKLEKDLKENKKPKEIEKDLASVLNLKNYFPVKHIPEINYLINEEIEKVPPTVLTNFYRTSFFLLPLRNSSQTINFILCLLSAIYITQFLKVRGIYKLSLTIISLIILLFCFIFNVQVLILLISGIASGIIYKLRKKRISLFLLLTSFILLVSQSIINLLSNLSQNPTYLYNLKLERDGYLPTFLIDEAINDTKARSLEKITNNLVLGDLKSIKKLKLTEYNLQQIYFNDLGYVSFLEGNYTEALKYFKKALSIKENKFILYNLYLTYSSLLQIKKADEIKNKLSRNLNISNLPPVPLLIHVPVKVNVQIPSLIPFVFLLIGISLGYLISTKILQDNIEFNSRVANILWMKEFLKDRIKVFFILFFISVLANLILGFISCRS